VVQGGGEQLAQCEPVMFVLQSREGALDAVLDGPVSTLRNAAKTLKVIAMAEGKKSAATLRLISGLQNAGLLPRE
jgi:hypothetical protein